MAPLLVQSQRAAGNSGVSASVTLPAASTAGNLLVLFVDAWRNAGNVVFTPPANWTQAGATTQDNVYIGATAAQYYYPNNPGGLTTIAVTLDVAPGAWHIEVLEFSGVATTTPLDVQSIRQQSGTTTPSSGSVTTTQSGDLLVGWMSENDVNGAYTLTQPGGWTALPRNQDAGAWASLYSAYQVQTSAGAAQYNPTLTSTQTDSVMGILAFFASGGGGGTVNGLGVSEGHGQGQATATLATSAQSTGSGQATAQATIAASAQSTGHAADVAQGARIQPAGAVSQGIGQGVAVIPSAQPLPTPLVRSLLLAATPTAVSVTLATAPTAVRVTLASTPTAVSVTRG
jgi:hypothetical protein